MLSKAEIIYLKNPNSVSLSYGYVLKNRIRAKISSMQQEISLLNEAGLITRNCKNLTEFRKIGKEMVIDEISPNLFDFLNQKRGFGAPAGIWTRVADSKGQYT